MCTTASIHLNEKFIFARSLDLEYDFGDGITLVPRNFQLKFRGKDTSVRHSAFIGMAKVVDGYPLFADGFNEHGVCIAGLRFPDSDAYFNIKKRDKINLAPFEIIPYILATSKCARDAVAAMRNTHIVDIPFNDEIENTPMHFHITDGIEGAVVELSNGELNIYEDKAGVLTNSPPYPYHLYNLAHYLNLEPGSPKTSHGARVFSHGLMAHGLPGDYSSTSRFVKAAWLCRNACSPIGHETEVAESYIKAVSPPFGSVVSHNGGVHFTRYTALMEPGAMKYTLSAFGMPPKSATIEKESLDEDSLRIL